MCVACFDLWFALTLAQTSIQIRILKQVLAAERQRQQDTQVLLDSIAQQRPPGALLLTTEPTVAEAEVLAQLQVVTARQNERDAALDAQDLRQVLRGALQANSDAEMIRTLQVGRDEMPEAIKTLQRALEKEVERESVEGEPVLADAPAYTDAAVAPTPVTLARSATTATVLPDQPTSARQSTAAASSRCRVARLRSCWGSRTASLNDGLLPELPGSSPGEPETVPGGQAGPATAGRGRGGGWRGMSQ